MRILHFSDVHLDIPLNLIPCHEWLGKRVIGGLNQLLFRRRVFSRVDYKLERLVEFCHEQRVDLALGSGDFTMLGTEPEYRAVSASLQELHELPCGFIAVPGNHDVYMPNALRGRRFERYFSQAMRSDRPELRVDHAWPAVRLFGSDLAVISVNSARPNPVPWKSSGRIPANQLQGLNRILALPELVGRCVLVMTHYAPVLEQAEEDRRNHGLVNGREFLSSCAQLNGGALLFGHIHRCYRVTVPGVMPELFCAGSTTINAGGGLWLFELKDGLLKAQRGVWSGESYRLLD